MSNQVYDNKLRGAFFKNKKKTSENHPDYNGNYTDENGVEFWASAWVKKDKNGNQFLSFSMKRKDEAQKPTEQPKPQQQHPSNDDDDSLPF